MSRRRHQPEPGDLIEIERSVYQHRAIYLGDGYVIHVTPKDEWIPPLSAGRVTILTKKAKVKKELLKEVVGTDDWKVNNKYDGSRTPLPVEEIISHAERCIDREVTYDVLDSNCEHFVTWLRYGEGESKQVKRAIRGITFLSREVVPFVLIGGLAGVPTGFFFGPVAAVFAAAVGASASAVLVVVIQKRKSN